MKKTKMKPNAYYCSLNLHFPLQEINLHLYKFLPYLSLSSQALSQIILVIRLIGRVSARYSRNFVNISWDATILGTTNRFGVCLFIPGLFARPHATTMQHTSAQRSQAREFTLMFVPSEEWRPSNGITTKVHCNTQVFCNERLDSRYAVRALIGVSKTAYRSAFRDRVNMREPPRYSGYTLRKKAGTYDSPVRRRYSVFLHTARWFIVIEICSWCWGLFSPASISRGCRGSRSLKGSKCLYFSRRSIKLQVCSVCRKECWRKLLHRDPCILASIWIGETQFLRTGSVNIGTRIVTCW